MTRDERIANALSTSVQIDANLDNAVKYSFDEPDRFAHDYEEATRAIVEPKLDPQDEDFYIEWMENDVDNWVTFITMNLGGMWGQIAGLVKENGY